MAATGRRFLGFVPRLVGRVWNEIARELQDYLERLRDSVTNGIPGGVGTDLPSTVEADATPQIGLESAGWAPMDHTHPVSVGTAIDLGEATAEGTGSALARADHVHKLAVRVKENADASITRKQIHLTDTTTIAWTVTEDVGNDEVDVVADVLLSGLTHNLLSVTHPDTVASAPSTGSLIVGNSTPAWEEFPVGSDGDVLTADSAEPFGVKWEAPSGGGGGGWTDDGTIVRLTTATDDVKVGGDPATVDGPFHVTTASGEKVIVAVHGDPHTTDFSTISLRRSRGTETSPTATTTSSIIGRLSAEGYWSGAYYDAIQLEFLAGSDALPGRFIIRLLDASGGSFNVMDMQWSIVQFSASVWSTVIGSHGAIKAINEEDADSHVDVATFLRRRSSATTPGVGMFGSLSLRLEGFTAASEIQSADISWGWEVAQSNDTTDRDSFISFRVMQDNTLDEAGRFDSNRSLLVGTTTSNSTYKLVINGSAWVTKLQAGLAANAALTGNVNVSLDAAGVHYFAEHAESATSPVIFRIQRARGSLGSKSVLSAADQLFDLDIQGHNGTSLQNAAKMLVDVEAVASGNVGGRFGFYTALGAAMGGANVLRFSVHHNGNVIVGNQTSALATTAVQGFFYIPTCAGTPTGVPASLPTGVAPMVYDSTNFILYVYSGGAWRAH